MFTVNLKVMVAFAIFAMASLADFYMRLKSKGVKLTIDTENYVKQH